MIRQWHICISGFMQKLGQRHGVNALYRRMRNTFSHPAIELDLRVWNTNWHEYVEHIYDLSTNGGSTPVVVVHAYSWGAGHGFIQLAKRLRRRGFEVDHAVLCDPVYRASWWLRRWRAFNPFQTITIPSNVRRVDSFSQVEDWPRGHTLIAEAPEQTKIAAKSGPVGVGHTAMDDWRDWHDRALKVSQGFVNRLESDRC